MLRAIAIVHFFHLSLLERHGINARPTLEWYHGSLLSLKISENKDLENNIEQEM